MTPVEFRASAWRFTINVQGARMEKQIRPKQSDKHLHHDGRINVYDAAELKHWARELGVSVSQIMSATQKAGTGIEAVKNELRRRTALRV